MKLTNIQFGKLTIHQDRVKSVLGEPQYQQFRLGVLGQPGRQVNDYIVQALADADIHVDFDQHEKCRTTIKASFKNSRGKQILPPSFYSTDLRENWATVPAHALMVGISEMGKRYAYLQQILSGNPVEQIRPIVRQTGIHSGWFVEA